MTQSQIRRWTGREPSVPYWLPHYEGFFIYGDNKPHCWSGPVSPSERLKEMAQFIQRKRPDGATTSWWTY